MATVPISFAVANKNPYYPSDNVAGANFTSRRADGLVNTNAFVCATDAVWSCDVDPVVNTFSVQVVFDTIASAAGGTTVSSGDTGNGFMFIANNTNVRVFAMSAWALSGSALGTYTPGLTTGQALNIDVTQSSGQYVVKNGSTVLGTFTNTTYTSGLKTGLTSRGNARIASFALSYTPTNSFDSLSALTPSAAFTGTCTGFSNGAATLSFAGVSTTVTITAGAFTGTLPMIADNIAWPRLPATGQTITLTQGAIVVTLVNQSISLPVGYDLVRDILGAPANFNALVTDNSEYLGYHFALAGNPLTILDSAVFNNTVGNYVIYQDSGVGSDVVPRTDTVYIYRNSSGKYFTHLVTLNEAGDIVGVSNLLGGLLGIYIGIGI